MRIETKALRNRHDSSSWTGVAALVMALVIGLLCPYMCYSDACAMPQTQEHDSGEHEATEGDAHNHEHCNGPTSHDHDTFYQVNDLTKNSDDKVSTLPVSAVPARANACEEAEYRTSSMSLPAQSLPTETVRLLI